MCPISDGTNDITKRGISSHFQMIWCLQSLSDELPSNKTLAQGKTEQDPDTEQSDSPFESMDNANRSQSQQINLFET